MLLCYRRHRLYRFHLQGYAKLIGVLRVIIYALLLNGVSSDSSIAQVSLIPHSCMQCHVLGYGFALLLCFNRAAHTVAVL